ncbi:MAG: LysM peptidoglycan-binding domain-containing protein [Lentisphaerae bacterium]|nr:LysM peptidoglycan-binding domain-containing protein [Lentisphaerota bacterium]
MLTRALACCVLAAALLAAGCASLGDSRRAAVREETRQDRLAADVERLKEAVNALQAGRQDVYQEVEAFRTRLDTLERNLGAELDALRLELKALETAREADKRAIIDSLSERISGIMRSAAAPASRRVESGYEHVVQPGETLSEIASAYNTRIDVIVRANNLSNPNAIRAGQTLFIPE